MGAVPLNEALGAVGELLAAEGETEAIVVVGGATLNLLGLVQRTTGDVDVIARAHADAGGDLHLERPLPFPAVLRRAIDTVARDFGLPENWMNATVAGQWDVGLPPWLVDDIEWRQFAGLAVGLVGRRTLVALKLAAAADSGPSSVHVQDLKTLTPTDDEFQDVAPWVISQDGSPDFERMVWEVVEHVRERRE